MSNENTNDKKQKSKLKEGLYTVFFMFIVTLVFISGLAGVNILTKDIIDFNKEISLVNSILYSAGLNLPKSSDKVKIVIPKDENGNPKSGFYEVSLIDENKKFAIESIKDKANKVKYYNVFSEQEIISYVFQTRGAGLWGEITALIGFDKQLETITGIEFVEQSETPGLGARIIEDWFKEQFKGKNGPASFDLNSDKLFTTYPEPKNKEETKTNNSNKTTFSAITGATITSNYVKEIINETIKIGQEELLEKENDK